MQQHGREFVCGLLVDFADGQAGRSDLIDVGSRECCLKAAQALVRKGASGNRPFAAAHIVIVSRDEWEEFYVAPDSRTSSVSRQTAMAASRTALELIASQLRARLTASDAGQTAAMAFIRRGVSELVNHVGKERAEAFVLQMLEGSQDDLSEAGMETGKDDIVAAGDKTAAHIAGSWP